MKKALKRLFRFPWYVAALAAYPPLALLLVNISEIRLSGAFRSVLVSVVVAAALTALFHLAYLDWHRAAFAASGTVILFFTYGHVYELLAKEIPQVALDPWLWVLWILLEVLVLLWMGRRKSHPEKAAPGINLISLGLLLFVIIQSAWYTPPAGSLEPAAEFAPVQELALPQDGSAPDIYYIILDSYGRSDLLARNFKYDNSGFINGLEELGFFVAGCTQSNYNRTDVSLGSSLNLDYLQNLSPDYTPPSQDRRTLWASIQNSAVRLMLEQAGYTSYAFATGFAWSEVKISDEFLVPHSLVGSLSSFEVLLLRTTPARYLETSGLLNLAELDGRHYRERTQYIFDEMERLARLPGPKFVFIHLIPPHPPFVFGPDGSETDPALFLDEDQRYTSEAYRSGYRNQVEYISTEVLEAARTLIENSDTPPVIVIQGDHAPWLQTGHGKFQILNAYHLPGHEDLPYARISPVNTFRLIFNAYLGAEYVLLPDISYYSPVPNIYEFETIPHPCP